MPKYSQEKKLVKVTGSIINRNKYEFTYLANKENSSLGSPIFLENRIDIIGIKKKDNKDKTNHYGDFIYPIFNLVKEEINKKRNNGKYLNGKYIWDNDKYYIGEFKNNIPNGKGIKYHKNGKIEYEGDFINGKFEGNGKFIYYDGCYYIGKFKDGLRNGKGTIYYPNGNIEIEGNFLNNRVDGYGKYIWEEGEYYIGEWKKGLMHGKGTVFYSNGNIQYEGGYFNGARGGYGKYIWEDGEYYEGEWRNGLKHGKGKFFYSDGKIKYEGEFFNDKWEGHGKYIDQEGKYYFIGEYKNGYLNGKGTVYNLADDKIKYEGDFINGKFEGRGKLFYDDGKYYIGQFRNHLQHGKGTEYDSNGKIQYKGDYIDGLREGNGKCITEYMLFIGQYKNGKPKKGKLYNSNGKILLYDGDFINGEMPDGIKLYRLNDGGYYVGQIKNHLYHGKGTLFNSDGTIKQKGNWIDNEYIGN